MAVAVGVSDMWQVTSNMWHMTFDKWQWHMKCDMWHVKRYMWNMKCDRWYVTNDTWHMTPDIWHIKPDFFSIFSSSSLDKILFYLCYYLYMLRDSVFPICEIFFVLLRLGNILLSIFFKSPLIHICKENLFHHIKCLSRLHDICLLLIKLFFTQYKA